LNWQKTFNKFSRWFIFINLRAWKQSFLVFLYIKTTFYTLSLKQRRGMTIVPGLFENKAYSYFSVT